MLAYIDQRHCHSFMEVPREAQQRALFSHINHRERELFWEAVAKQPSDQAEVVETV
jgi:hypothetical protein